MTKPVLYYHFESKEGLYLTLMEESLGSFRAAVEAALRSDGGTAADRIRRLCEALVGHALENLSIVRLTRGLHYAPPQGAPAFDACEFPRTIQSALSSSSRRGCARGEFAAVAPRTSSGRSWGCSPSASTPTWSTRGWRSSRAACARR